MLRPLVELSPRSASARVDPAERMRRLTGQRGGARWKQRLELWSARLPLVVGTYLSKLSVPPFGAMGLALSIPLMAAVAVGGFAAGLMVLHVRRAFAFVLMLAVLLSLQVVAADHFSPNSLALLVVVHLPYAFQLRRTERRRDNALRYFQRIAMTIAVLGILQYVGQFVIGAKYAFPIENLAPAALKVANFNSTGLLQYGSEVMRANGVFMIEPSFFSQLMAVGIIIELVTSKRPVYFVVMVIAILVSYSGTGLMLLAAGLLCECMIRQRWDVLLGIVGLCMLVAAVGVAADVRMITNILNRSSEFSSTGSSASMRFVGGFQLFEQFLWPDPFRAMFGFGAGSTVEFIAKATVPFAETILFKPIFEYGIVGAIAYFGFLGYCVFSASAPMAVRVAVAMAIMLGGMYTPFGHCLACGLLLWRNPRNADAQAPVKSPARFGPGHAVAWKASLATQPGLISRRTP